MKCIFPSLQDGPHRGLPSTAMARRSKTSIIVRTYSIQCRRRESFKSFPLHLQSKSSFRALDRRRLSSAVHSPAPAPSSASLGRDEVAILAPPPIVGHLSHADPAQDIRNLGALGDQRISLPQLHDDLFRFCRSSSASRSPQGQNPYLNRTTSF